MALQKSLSTSSNSARSTLFIWAFVLAVVIGFGIVKVYPQVNEWINLGNKNNNIKTEIQNIQQEIDQLKNVKTETKSEFDKASAPFLTEENQTLPERIDVAKVTQIFELYGIQLANFNTKGTEKEFEIDQLSFGVSMRVPGSQFAQTPVSLSIKATDEKVKMFFNFLETGKIQEELKQASSEVSSQKFLENNLIPLAHIQSVQVSENKTESKTKTVQLEIVLFSQQ